MGEVLICLVVLAALAAWIYGATQLARDRVSPGIFYIISALLAFVLIWLVTLSTIRHQRRTRQGAGVRPRRLGRRK